MLIISQFGDYYDGVLSHGVDKSIVYRRNPSFERRKLTTQTDKVLTGFIAQLAPNVLHMAKRSYTGLDLNVLTSKVDSNDDVLQNIVFAFVGGKVYITVSKKSIDDDYSTFNENDHNDKTLRVVTAGYARSGAKWFSSLEKIEDEFILTDNKSGIAQLTHVNEPSGWRAGKLNNSLLAELFEKQGTEVPAEVFIEAGTPVFAVEVPLTRHSGYTTLFKNPCLKLLQLQSVIPPYQAFQDIMQYQSGVLGTAEKETITIADKYMVQAKGFDAKSFRNRGTKKPRKSKKG